MNLENIALATKIMQELEGIDGRLDKIDKFPAVTEVTLGFGNEDKLRIFNEEDCRSIRQLYRNTLHNKRKQLRKKLESL